jgi:hypothetical protein
MHRDLGIPRLLLFVGFAALLLEWLPGVFGPYGYFIDEFYYLACARRLDWGYVDHPPLSIAMLAGWRAVAGDSLLALRFPAAFLGGLTAIATGLLARRLGAGTFGQLLAALAMVCAGVPMVLFSFYSMNALDLLLWTIAFWLLIEIEDRDDARLWLAWGAVLGIGLQNKHTIVLLPLALGAGMLLTRARRHLIEPRFWVAAGIAGLLLVPNLMWQAGHGWPSLEFYANADIYKNNPTPPLVVVLQQVLFMNPLALPVWVAGLVFLLGRGHAGRLRHLGLVYVLLLLLLAVGQKSRPDRLTPVYPLLFAAGGAAIHGFVSRRRAAWLRPVAIGAVTLGGLVFMPVGLPLLPPSVVAPYGARLGLVPQIEAGEGKRSALPQWLSDRLDWEALVRDVEGVVRRLPKSERAASAIIAPSYGHGGSLELLGRGAGLPPVYATQNTYAFWGPPPDSLTTWIVIGYSESDVRESFARVERAATHRCDWCTPWRDDMPIWIARDRTLPTAEIWGSSRHFE